LGPLRRDALDTVPANELISAIPGSQEAGLMSPGWSGDAKIPAKKGLYAISRIMVG